MATLITVNGNTSKSFVAENVTSITKYVDADGSYDVSVNLSADKHIFPFAVEADRDTVFDGIVAIIGTVTDISP